MAAPKTGVRVAVCGFMTLLALAQPAVAQTLLITNARVLDVGPRTERTANILIKDGVIAGFPASPPKDFKGTVVDAGGKWVMPALSDMHTHSVGNSLSGGGFQMMGPRAGGRYFAAGPCLTAKVD